MQRFAPPAAWSSNRALPQSRRQSSARSTRHPKPPLSPPPRQHRRMAPDKTDASLHRPTAPSLRHARCLFHPLREAASRCPHCAGTFCRECVTDEDGKLACPPCLRRLARPIAPKASLARSFREILGGFAAFVCLSALIYALLLWRVNTSKEHLDLGSVVDLVSGQSHE